MKRLYKNKFGAEEKLWVKQGFPRRASHFNVKVGNVFKY